MHEMGFWPVFSSPSLPSFEMEMSVVRSDLLTQPPSSLFHSQVCDNKFSIRNVRASEIVLADSDSWRILNLTSSLYDVASSNREVCDKWWRKITRWIMILGFEDSALLWHKKILCQNSDHPIPVTRGWRKSLISRQKTFSLSFHDGDLQRSTI